LWGGRCLSYLERCIREGENPVSCSASPPPVQGHFQESGCLGMQPKMGGKFHLKLNTGTRPIANKYREGKMKSTLKRESKAREAVKMETIKVSSAGLAINLALPCRGWLARGQSPTAVQCKRGEAGCTCWVLQVSIGLRCAGQGAEEGDPTSNGWKL